MDYSVIRTGGKQYIVAQNEELFIEKLAETGAHVEFETLLRVKGDNVEFGEPTLSTSTKGEIIDNAKGKKTQGIKYKSGGYRRKFGHRQNYSKVKIVEL